MRSLIPATTVGRLAAALATVLLLGAVAATFLPTSPQGATCGTWVAPEWDDEDTSELLSDYADLSDSMDESSMFSDMQQETEGMAYGIAMSKRLCDDALGTRRTMSLVLLGSAVLLPAGVMFVGGTRREREQEAVR